MKISTLIITIIFSTISASAQKRNIDKIIYHPDSRHNPHLAAMHSLIIPGWGQVYNHHYWKVPLVYGALASFAAIVIYNQHYYAEFIALARIKRTGSVPTSSSPYYFLYQRYKNAYDLDGNRSSDDLANIANDFVRDRDLGILGFAGFWGLNIIDAYISAKFIQRYTMDNNLAFKISPALIYQGSYAANNRIMPSLKITISLN